MLLNKTAKSVLGWWRSGSAYDSNLQSNRSCGPRFDPVSPQTFLTPRAVEHPLYLLAREELQVGKGDVFVNQSMHASCLLSFGVPSHDLLPVQTLPPVGGILLLSPNPIFLSHIGELVQVQYSQRDGPSVFGPSTGTRETASRR